MRRKIGILICGRLAPELSRQFGEYDGVFRRLLGEDFFEYEVFWVVEDEFPDSVDRCDGWILTGSSHGVYDDLPFIGRLENFVTDAFEAGIPVAGICFGHQLIAQAMGGRVEKFSGGWGLGVHTYRLTSSMEQPADVNLIAVHQDQVVQKPPRANVIASSAFCRFAGLEYSDTSGNTLRKAISFQPHPEFNEAWLRAIVDLRGGKTVSEELAKDAVSSLTQPQHAHIIADRLQQFFNN